MRHVPRADFAGILSIQLAMGLSVNSRVTIVGIQIRLNFDDYLVVIRVCDAVTPCASFLVALSVQSCRVPPQFRNMEAGLTTSGDCGFRAFHAAKESM